MASIGRGWIKCSCGNRKAAGAAMCKTCRELDSGYRRCVICDKPLKKAVMCNYDNQTDDWLSPLGHTIDGREGSEERGWQILGRDCAERLVRIGRAKASWFRWAEAFTADPSEMEVFDHA